MFYKFFIFLRQKLSVPQFFNLLYINIYILVPLLKSWALSENRSTQEI